MKRPAAVDRVVEAARERGLDIEIREFPDGTRTAQEAADAIGVDVAQIVKSLAFAVDGSIVIALLSGANRLDEKALAAVAGADHVERPNADAVREATSYAIGGIPPFGYPADLPTYADRDLLTLDVVWAAAGSHIHVFAIAPDALVRATNAQVADLAAR